jgi:glycosyltransferase involved in cell wall biosynthesis
MTGEYRGERISVVIPTRARPSLVLRAVRSALHQSFSPAEVIVVVDGPDDSTAAALGSIRDTRLKVVILEETAGPADARNAGVEACSSQWIAFLDDDDEWLPRKLEVQIEVAKLSCHALPIVTSRFVARTPNGEFVWPRRLPAPGEPLSEYLLVRRSTFLGETWIGTPTVLARTDLLRKVPFTSDLQVHEDWDWILRASVAKDVGIEFVPEPLAICYLQEERASASAAHGWQRSLAWIRECRDLVTPRAYAGFVATIVSPKAAQQRQWNAFLPLLRELVNPGRPRLLELLLFTGMWLVPQELRRRLRGLLVRKRRT